VSSAWANSGVDLHVELAGTRARAGLEQALRDAIRSGRLAAGARLPPTRSLAGDLGLSRNTVAAAYSQLVAEGWLSARRGAGTTVAAHATATDPAVRPAPPTSGARHDLRAGTPDLASFPRSGWLAAARRALVASPYSALGYGDPRGLPELRQALAGYLARARGVHASADRIVVCSGFAHGLTLLCSVLRAGGARSVAAEAFGHASFRETIERAGLRATTIDVDEQGAVVGDLGGEDAVVLTPAHQFPLGHALAPSRRTACVAWARDRGAIVVEDDYDGEFRYDRQPVGALQALAPDHVVYCGTASKSLAPGLRLGWLVLPQRLVDEVAETRRLTGGPSALDQLVLAELIESGAYDRHVRRARHAYRRRRDRLTAALRLPVAGVAAGMHVLVELHEPERDVVERAARASLRVEGLSEYAAPGTAHGPALVVGYGTPPEHAFEAAVAALARVL
jgi:GntR family transcriptional regulator/MocR family aminotransferase